MNGNDSGSDGGHPLPDRTALAGRILEQLRADFSRGWATRLSAADRQLIEAVAADAAAVVLLALTAPPDVAEREKAHVDAQLMNVASAETARVVRAFWRSVGAALKAAVGFAVALA
jgi:hypothetical protein